MTNVQVPGLTRTDLQRQDLSVPGRELIQNRVDIAPDDGREPAIFNAGEALLVPPETVHSVRNVGSESAAELATYIVEKGKPLLVLVD